MKSKNLHDLISDVYQDILKYVVGSEAKPRAGIVEVLREIKSNYAVILSAPPGYGKTMIPYCLGYFSCARSDLWPLRTIHVLPLRSIIEDCFNKLFRGEKEPKIPLLTKEVVARQTMDEAGSPWLQRRLIFTTLDTFTMCAVRLPPAELQKIARTVSMGHGLLSKSAILSSTIVFDEVHLFVEEGGKMASVFSALLWWLRTFLTPLVIMSATLPTEVEKFLRERLGNRIRILRYGVDFTDEKFDEERRMAMEQLVTEKPRTGDIRDIVKEACIAKECYNRVLVVLNTVKRCIEVAKALESLGLKPIVLHSKIASIQRSDRLCQLKGDEWLAVATQVVEAGVDISSQYLITDGAPPCALVQRAGRLLRWKKDIGLEGKMITFVDKKAIESEVYHGIYNTCLLYTSPSPRDRG